MYMLISISSLYPIEVGCEYNRSQYLLEVSIPKVPSSKKNFKNGYSIIAWYTMVLKVSRKGRLLAGISWVRKRKIISALGSIQ